MPFIVTENPAAAVCTVEAVRENPLYGSFQRALEEQRVHISDISVGSVKYPLRRQLRGTFTRALRELAVDGVSPMITGIGDSLQEAQSDFCLKVHASFQKLLGLRPFELTVDDRLVWETLVGIIDVTVYRNTTPIVVRQYSRISKARPYPLEVEWDDGHRESVTLSDVTDPDYVTYRPGQPFEAVIQRDPLTFRLLRVIHIRRCREPKRLAPDDEQSLLEDIGSTKQLPQDNKWQP